MKRINLIAYLFFINMLILLIAGCDLAPPTSEPVDFMTITVTLTAIPTSTKTPLPINTLTALERENFVRESLSNSSDCTLPCWWGITPGETTWLETEQLLYFLGFRVGTVPGTEPTTIWHGTGGFDFQGLSTKHNIGFVELDGVVNAVLIQIDGYYKPEEDFKSLWESYSPKKIIELYGVPDRVLLNVPGHSSPNPYRGYYLWVFYEPLGFMLRYGGEVLNDPNYLHICPKIGLDGEIDSLDIKLQSIDSSLPLERFDPILEDIRLQTETGKTRVLHSIEEATGMNEKEFYDLFMQEDELICFETPSDIWDIEK